jgi:anaerobic nitric oxide reductase flavorubredoxin
MSILVKNNIHWVGQRDWEVRDFHGTEYKTLRGSSYNSYLIREGKNVLIDTVDHKFSREFVQNLRSEIDLDASTTSSSTTRKKITPVR